MQINDIARRTGGWAGVVGLALLGAGACGDNIGPGGDGEGHVFPSAVLLVLDGVEIARAEDLDRPTGSIEVTVGEQTETITVEFVDANDLPVRLTDAYFLEVDVSDESIAQFEQGLPREFMGRVRGVAEGETEMTFKLMHGTPGEVNHVEFMPVAIPVIVAPGV